MQPKFGESAGQLGSGYELFIVDDWIAINTPSDEQLQIPFSQVVACTNDDDYFFIAHASRSAADATVYEIDFGAGTHRTYTLPNNHASIVSHIRTISPDARLRDPMMLTGDGRIIFIAGQVVAFAAIGLMAVMVGILILMAVRARIKKRRRGHQHA
ncbi:MAG: hypothetical protein ACIAS6_02935 [Phycisphaerales bacterium JB060]